MNAAGVVVLIGLSSGHDGGADHVMQREALLQRLRQHGAIVEIAAPRSVRPRREGGRTNYRAGEFMLVAALAALTPLSGLQPPRHLDAWLETDSRASAQSVGRPWSARPSPEEAAQAAVQRLAFAGNEFAAMATAEFISPQPRHVADPGGEPSAMANRQRADATISTNIASDLVDPDAPDGANSVTASSAVSSVIRVEAMHAAASPEAKSIAAEEQRNPNVAPLTKQSSRAITASIHAEVALRKWGGTRISLPFKVGSAASRGSGGLVIGRLPGGITFSHGSLIGPGVWHIPIAAADTTEMIVDAAAPGTFELTYALVDASGTVENGLQVAFALRAPTVGAPLAPVPLAPARAVSRSPNVQRKASPAVRPEIEERTRQRNRGDRPHGRAQGRPRPSTLDHSRSSLGAGPQ
ncbi:MAG: hypothetical protein ABL908_05320, partial [Hyphomicrobium sp.]